ncbi:MAG: carboxylating nicotinate-nucleotide diphosphorylase [Bdellovibrionales bacterium]|nr:carboxylating nicotinate-nucleotide diphosphorylase [Bdellovibrionales bacterium]
MKSLIQPWKKWILTGIEEDSSSFDWTARATARARGPDADKQIQAALIAKANGIWAAAMGLDALEILSLEHGLPLKIESHSKDGSELSSGQKICTWTGTPEAIVTFERTFINLAAYTSGIATRTREFVKKAQNKGLKNTPRITATRKTLPGYRDLAIQSTLIGGAHPHRFNLSGGLLLKENHIAAAGSIANAVRSARETIPHLLKIEIEVRNLNELSEAICAGAEVIMLDNFSPSQIRDAMRLKPTGAGVVFEVSGGIQLHNLDEYLIEGVDVISVGSLTHSVTALDLSLLV